MTDNLQKRVARMMCCGYNSGECGSKSARLCASDEYVGFAQIVIALAREDAAKVADAFADENFRMCTDSIMNDPVLAAARKNRIKSTTPADWAASEGYQIDGTIHSAMAHAAQNIAASIRNQQ